MKNTAVKRLVAGVLLLYAAADLSIPGFCPYEVGLGSLVEALAPRAVSSIHGAATSSPASDTDDNCYCCSTCIRLVNSIPLAIPELVEYRTVVPRLRILSGFTADNDHPPRA